MVVGIYFLSGKDFHVRQNIDGKLLSLEADIKGINLVLFYSNECSYCDEVMLEFKKLPEHIFGCSFSMINLNQNKDVVHMSKETLTPLTYVPEMILYLDNLPYTKYEGKASLEEIQQFIRDVSNNLQNNTFTTTTPSVKHEEPMISTTTTKSPYVIENTDLPVSKKTKKVCYLEDDGNLVCN